MEHALAQQSKTSPPEHHTFDELNPGHLPFNLAIAVRERQPSQDRRFVSLQTIGKTLEFRDTTGFNLA